jgi:6,7-dimethyl-8-ribityllumazine synthase
MNILIVESRYHPAVADALTDGATAVLAKLGARFERASVPGALEVPAAIALAARTGRFEAYVALGSVVRERNPQFELIARETAAGLMRLATDQALCIGNGVIAADSEDEALRLADEGDAGGDAARACLSLLSLKGRLS